MIATGLSPFGFLETSHADFNRLTSIPEELHNFEGTLVRLGGTPGISSNFSAVRQTPAIVSSTLSGDRPIWVFRDCDRSHPNKHIGGSSAITDLPHTPWPPI